MVYTEIFQGGRLQVENKIIKSVSGPGHGQKTFPNLHSKLE